MMGSYRVAGVKDRSRIAEFLSKEGQVLLPLVDLVEEARLAVDDLVEVVGRAAIEAVLVLSGRGVAGPKQRGKARGEIRWHGRQAGRVCMSDRKLRVDRPRLRRKGRGCGGEVEIPAYETMVSNSGLGRRMLEVVLAGVSARNYGRVIPDMADAVGVSRSAVSREFMEASEEELRRLLDRRFDDVDLIVMYIDGMRFGEHHVIAAVGVDAEGRKHVLGVAEGATENAAVVRGLLEDLAERGRNVLGYAGRAAEYAMLAETIDELGRFDAARRAHRAKLARLGVQALEGVAAEDLDREFLRRRQFRVRPVLVHVLLDERVHHLRPEVDTISLDPHAGLPGEPFEDLRIAGLYADVLENAQRCLVHLLQLLRRQSAGDAVSHHAPAFPSCGGENAPAFGSQPRAVLHLQQAGYGPSEHVLLLAVTEPQRSYLVQLRPHKGQRVRGPARAVGAPEDFP